MLTWNISLPSSAPQLPPASSGVPPGTTPSSGVRTAAAAGFFPGSVRSASESPQRTGLTSACSRPLPPGLMEPEFQLAQQAYDTSLKPACLALSYYQRQRDTVLYVTWVCLSSALQWPTIRQGKLLQLPSSLPTYFLSCVYFQLPDNSVYVIKMHDI